MRHHQDTLGPTQPQCDRLWLCAVAGPQSLWCDGVHGGPQPYEEGAAGHHQEPAGCWHTYRGPIWATGGMRLQDCSIFFFLSFFFIHNSLCLDSLLFFFFKENLYPNSGVKYGHITFAHFIQLIKATLSVAYCIKLDTELSINMESAMTQSVARPTWQQPAKGTISTPIPNKW